MQVSTILPPSYKLILLGECDVGKTSLFERFRNKDIPNSRQASIAIDRSQFSRQLAVGKDSKPVEIELWDTADMERARSLTETYFRGSSAGLLVYDISRSVTLRRIPEWIRSFHYRVEKAPIFLVGNKLDLEAEEYSNGETTRVHASEILGKNFQEIVDVYEVSAKDDIAVESMYHQVAERLSSFDKLKEWSGTEVDSSGDVIGLHYRQSQCDIDVQLERGVKRKRTKVGCC